MNEEEIKYIINVYLNTIILFYQINYNTIDNVFISNNNYIKIFNDKTEIFNNDKKLNNSKNDYLFAEIFLFFHNGLNI